MAAWGIWTATVWWTSSWGYTLMTTAVLLLGRSTSSFSSPPVRHRPRRQCPRSFHFRPRQGFLFQPRQPSQFRPQPRCQQLRHQHNCRARSQRRFPPSHASLVNTSVPDHARRAKSAGTRSRREEAPRNVATARVGPTQRELAHAPRVQARRALPALVRPSEALAPPLPSAPRANRASTLRPVAQAV